MMIKFYSIAPLSFKDGKKCEDINVSKLPFFFKGKKMFAKSLRVVEVVHFGPPIHTFPSLMTIFIVRCLVAGRGTSLDIYVTVFL